MLTGYDPLRGERPPNLDDAFVISNNSVTPGGCSCYTTILGHSFLMWESLKEYFKIDFLRPYG